MPNLITLCCYQESETFDYVNKNNHCQDGSKDSTSQCCTNDGSRRGDYNIINEGAVAKSIQNYMYGNMNSRHIVKYKIQEKKKTKD